MVAYTLCDGCRGIVGPFTTGPIHCYGSADRPAPPGVMGGFRCSCPCRYEAQEPEDA